MGQITIAVTLRNAREVVMARLGHLSPEHVHTYETAALIDTGTMRSVLPPAVADALGLVRLYRTAAQMADGHWGEVDVTEAVELTLVAGISRVTQVPMLVMGERVLLGATVLEDLDLLVDCARQRLVPNVGTWDQPVFRV
jgi:predicted aspartyl protease